MSSSYIHTADPSAATSEAGVAPSANTSTPQTSITPLTNAGRSHSQTKAQDQAFQTTQFNVNKSSFAANGTSSFRTHSLGDLSSISHFPTTAQEILKRASENTTVVSGSPAWEAAREQVLKSMAGSTHTLTPLQPVRGRGRGRPPSNHRTIRIQTAAPLPVVTNGDVTGDPSGVTTPVKKGRGRGRVRGSRGSTRGRGGKRKREDDTDGSPSEDDSEISDSYTPLTTVTKSGRNVTKPSQFNPAADMSPDGEPKRRRSYRRGPEFTLCVKCERGHSPSSNAIVFCDGCNSAYHQWCHDPHIPREVVEVTEQEWFCSKCQHKKEIESLPMDLRVSGEGLSTEEKLTYLSTLSSITLKSLLIKALELDPTIPIFAPNTREIIKTKPLQLLKPNSIPSPPVSQASSVAPLPTIKATSTSNSIPTSIEPNRLTAEEVEDPYPDYSNPSGDPPATYPRPGHGPIKIRPTTDPEDLPWLLDDNFEVFSHLVDDGSGNLVPVDRSDGWARKHKEEEGGSGVNRNGVDRGANGAGPEEDPAKGEGDQGESSIFHGLTADEMDMA